MGSKEQTLAYMNLFAYFLMILEEFSFPFQELHALQDFQEVFKTEQAELDNIFQYGTDSQKILEELEAVYHRIKREKPQKRILSAYFICIRMDDMLTYDRNSLNKFSIFALLPL